MKKTIIALCLVVFSLSSFADDNNIDGKDQENLWSLLFYRGTTSGQSFLGVISFHYSGIGETMYSAELAYTLSKYNVINKYLNPYATFQFAGNLGERFSTQENDWTFEGDLYLILRWKYFPWNHFVTTTVAIGDGGSYTSHILPGEKDDPGLKPGTTSNDLRRFLNFFLLEATFAMPKHPKLQLVTRLHHRCTLFGVTSSSKQGSTNIGVGIRYYF
jgi:hypothetical protein